jgi:hypothetical protein
LPSIHRTGTDAGVSRPFIALVEESGMKVKQAGTANWWRVKGEKRFPAAPSHGGSEGLFLCDEAVGLVAEMAEWLGDYATELYQFRPTRQAVDWLLTGANGTPDWAEGDDEIMAKAEETVGRLADIYLVAWGRLPSDEECFELTGAVRKQHCRWLN